MRRFALIALLVSGCGGDDDAATAADAPPPPEVDAAEPETDATPAADATMGQPGWQAAVPVVAAEPEIWMVDADAAGEWFVVGWAAGGAIHARVAEGTGGWGAPMTIYDDDPPADSVFVDVDESGAVAVAWNQGTLAGGYVVGAAHYTPAGGWSEPAVLGAALSRFGQVAVAAHGEGATVVGNDGHFWASSLAAGGWSSAAPIDPGHPGSRDPAIEVTASGATLVAYGEQQTPAATSFPAIWISERAAGGAWGDPLLVSDQEGFFLGEGQDTASAGLSDGGDAAVAWRRRGSGASQADYLWALRIDGVWSGGRFDTGLRDGEPRPAYDATFAGAADGTFLAVYRNDDVCATLHMPGAAAWEPMAILAEADPPGIEPVAAAAAGGRALAIWLDGQREQVVASVHAGGAWTPAANAAAAPLDLVWKQPLLADAGNGWALWWSGSEGVGAAAWLP